MCCVTTSDPTFSPWAVKFIGKLSDEARSPDGKRIALGPGAQLGRRRRRFRRLVLVALGALVVLVLSLVFASRLAVAAPLNPTSAAVLRLASLASNVALSATTSLFNVAGGCVPVAFLVWAVNSKLDSVIEELRRSVKRQEDEAITELGADTDSLIKQRGLLNDVTVELAVNADEPDIP